MPSPFPGMNPYLEHADVWHDFHENFLPAARELLLPQVRPHYIIKIDQHVYLHEPAAEDRFFIGRSDVHVAQPTPAANPGAGTATLPAPAWGRVAVPIDEEKQSFLEIRDREGRDLVAVIELLSPINKAMGADRDQFLAKRMRYIRSSASYIEIDLLRGGVRLPIEDLPHCDYYALVSRWQERPRVGIWPLRMRDTLPAIPIPLREPHPNAQLDLQAVLNRVYDAAGYEDYIYSHQPEPRLHPDDEAWAKEIVVRGRQ